MTTTVIGTIDDAQTIAVAHRPTLGTRQEVPGLSTVYSDRTFLRLLPRLDSNQ